MIQAHIFSHWYDSCSYLLISWRAWFPRLSRCSVYSKTILPAKQLFVQEITYSGAYETSTHEGRQKVNKDLAISLLRLHAPHTLY